ncbi:hypothetical protein ZIOFF_070115 [Zingiber officinale]|uniref:Retroviral polymerase SH3-like domain-containing protein n=1 Tax=Zingiber officinale TaxID=94328 RepID=A0A8J5EUD8_ZINOF|nr:hypothetical protein ZIOFF_070115 [Zingiber officinale]
MSKGYRLFSLKESQVIISRDVQVDENASWNWEENKVETKDVLIITDKEDHDEPISSVTSPSDPNSAQLNEESHNSADSTSSNSSSPSSTPKSDLGGSLDDMKSTSGYCFSFGSATFSWLSKKQQSVAQSSAEAEYISASVATSQAIWLRRILGDLGHHQIEGTVLYCDNKSAIAMAKNPVHHSRTRHIALKHHFIRQAIEDKEIQLEFCRSEEQFLISLSQGDQLASTGLALEVARGIVPKRFQPPLSDRGYNIEPRQNTHASTETPKVHCITVSQSMKLSSIESNQKHENTAIRDMMQNNLDLKSEILNSFVQNFREQGKE